MISGSRYGFVDTQEQYSYFLDKLVPVRKVSLNNTDLIYSESSVYASSLITLPETYSAISEVYLYDNDGNLDYTWEIVYQGGDDFGGYWISRSSYLIQNVLWFVAVFGFMNVKRVHGIVYDSKSKKPLSGVIARVYSEGRLVHTYITTVLGLLDFRLKKGVYSIVLSKPGYTFPSNLRPLKEDDAYTDLYYGDSFEIKKDNSKAKLNVPLDSATEDVRTTPLDFVSNLTLSFFDSANPYLLIFVATTQMMIWPTFLDTWIFAALSTAILLAKYFVRSSAKVYFGTVTDSQGNPVTGLQVHLYDEQWGKFVRTFTTDAKGRFEAIELPDKYYVKISDPKFKLIGSDNDGKLMVTGKVVGNTMFINDSLTVQVLSPNSLDPATLIQK
ncbi:MAG TPA: carboxypeptidase-like regulatory domain-containing protein [Candidatus Dojkabacteria bacterium]|nr:carboxypeptidase-like regulatory domain-containing protein [Candidatus Dojkabacteria bacterium]